MWIEGPARFEETEGSAPRSVTLALDVKGLALRGPSGEALGFWPFGRLVVGRDAAAFVLLRSDAPGRILVTDPSTRAAFEAATKALPRAGDPKVPRSLSYAVLVVVAIVVVLVGLALKGLDALAGLLAPMVPEAAVEMLDEGARGSVLASLGTDESGRCTAPAGVAALDRLTQRLAAAGTDRPIAWKVGVWRSKVPNALALPGGTIVITDTLIARAGTADAFAGVLAHEIGHVHHRHGLKAMLHDGGLMAALSLVTGDTTGLVAAGGRLLVGASYSRDAEREADAFSVAVLAKAGGDPAALGPFLRSLGGSAGEGGLGGLLSTHPLTTEREATIATEASGTPRMAGPVIEPAAWTDLRAICG